MREITYPLYLLGVFCAFTLGFITAALFGAKITVERIPSGDKL